MTEARPVPPASVPTLTEVVDAPGGVALPAAAPAPAPPPLSEAELTERILQDLQHQVDLVVEYRIRERLTPILERAGDMLVREARAELARSLREVVARAVGSEMRRQRGG